MASMQRASFAVIRSLRNSLPGARRVYMAVLLTHCRGPCRLGWKFPWAVRVHMAELLLPHASNSFGPAGVQVAACYTPGSNP